MVCLQPPENEVLTFLARHRGAPIEITRQISEESKGYVSAAISGFQDVDGDDRWISRWPDWRKGKTGKIELAADRPIWHKSSGMNANTDAPIESSDLEIAMPLLFQKREYLEAMDSSGTTTSCQKTRNPNDYGPDD